MMTSFQNYRNAFGLICAGSLLLFTACATSTTPVSQAPAGPDKTQQTVAALNPDPPQSLESLDTLNDKNTQTLQALWRSRKTDRPSETTNSGFTIGPGDVLRISLPQLDQMKDRRVRVSETDTIDLPLLGQINVAGMTQDDLHQELARRVEKYVYKPQVAVYLEHTENRVAAVLGAVKTPGRYMLASSSDTIMTMISRAGGATPDAASRIIFIPAPIIPPQAHPEAVANHDESLGDLPADRQSGIVTASSSHVSMPPSLSQQVTDQGVVIDLFHSANERYLEMPVRTGDVIIVPVAGDVTVQGWVDKPGSFKITNGMTVLSAISAAGGALFTSSATLLREEGNDNKIAIPLDLARIKNGSQRDIAVQGGDVVVVERSAVGALPYTAYFLINKMGWGFFPAI